MAVPTYYVDSTYEVEGTAVRHHVSAPGVGPIDTVITDGALVSSRYHHTDHLGSTNVETDYAGTVLQYMVYEPYGKVRYNYQSGSYTNDYKYTGKEQDSETSWQYYGARYYDNNRGQFMSADPLFLSLGQGNLKGLTDPQKWNSYAYGRDNPYKMVDPDGRSFMHFLSVALAVTSNAVDAGYNFMTLGAGDKAAEMGQTGLTALGVAQVVAGVAWGTVTTAAEAASAGAFAAEVAIYTGVTEVAVDSFVADTVEVAPKAGSSGGPGAGGRFPESVKDQARAESGNTCVFCGEETTREPGPNQSQIDHAVPKSQGGNNTLDNAQNTCRDCNLDKGATTTEEYMSSLSDNQSYE